MTHTFHVKIKPKIQGVKNRKLLLYACIFPTRGYCSDVLSIHVWKHLG